MSSPLFHQCSCKAALSILCLQYVGTDFLRVDGTETQPRACFTLLQLPDGGT